MYLMMESRNPNPREEGVFREIIDMKTFKSIGINNVECFYAMLDKTYKEIVEMYKKGIKYIHYDYYGDFNGVIKLIELDTEDVKDIENETNLDIIKFIS